jgi:hypothetical protein
MFLLLPLFIYVLQFNCINANQNYDWVLLNSTMPVKLGEVAVGELNGFLYVVGYGSTTVATFRFSDMKWMPIDFTSNCDGCCFILNKIIMFSVVVFFCFVSSNQNHQKRKDYLLVIIIKLNL